MAQQRQPVTLVGRPVPAESGSNPFLLPSLLAVLCVAVLMGIAIRARRRSTGAPGQRALRVVSRSLGLSAEQRRLVVTIGGSEPAAVLISESAFMAAAEGWLVTMPEESQRLTLASLAGRLGWGVPALTPPLVTTELPRAKSGRAIGTAPTLKLVA